MSVSCSAFSPGRSDGLTQATFCSPAALSQPRLKGKKRLASPSVSATFLRSAYGPSKVSSAKDRLSEMAFACTNCSSLSK